MYLQQIPQIQDPVIDSTYKDIWMATAKVRKYFVVKAIGNPDSD